MSGDNDVVCVLWICVVVCAEWLGIRQALLITRGPPPYSCIGDCIALNNEGSDRGTGGAKTKGKPTHPHNSEKAGIEEDDDEYAGPSSLQYDAFHDGGRGE